MNSISFRNCLAMAAAILFLSAAGEAIAQTEDEVWPKGDNGPKVWPPELNNPWWQAEKKYPEGGDPPPLNLLSRLTCPEGYSRAKPKSANSAPWETSRWHPPEYAFDEYPVSRWSSNGSADKWLSADLGSAKTITRVYLIWEVAYGKDYDIRVSDDSVTWTTAKQVRGGNGQADVVEIPAAKGRYVQMMGVATGSPYGYSLYEFTICAGEGGTSLRRARMRAAAGGGWRLSMTPHGLPAGLRSYDLSGKAMVSGSRRSLASGLYALPVTR